MLNHLEKTLRDECRLEPTRKVLIGVSGGPDSLCLLDMLDQLGYSLVVAHFNHQMRREAQLEAEQVHRFTESRRLSFVGGERDVLSFAREQHLTVEEAARIARYRFLFEQAENTGAQAVAVAHTADDQVETVLMHLLRGSGLAGLKGMISRTIPNSWSKTIPLARPLLGVWRSEVLAYCEERGLKPLIDPSNLDRTFFRNRVRHELIPFLEGYNPSVQEVVWRMARVLAGEAEILEEVVQKAWLRCGAAAGPGYVSFDMQALQAEPVPVQRHLFRRAIAALRPGLRDIGFEAVERALRFLAEPASSAQIDLIAGLRLLFEPDRLWVAGWESVLPLAGLPKMPVGVELPLEVPGVLSLAEGWILFCKTISDLESGRRQAETNLDMYQAWASLDSSAAPITLRTRREGDRFQPLGMAESSMKLSDFMINVKIPRRSRHTWPLVCSGEEIVWVPGYRVGHAFRLTQSTRRAIYFCLRHEEK
ncbi:MAG: tRNA lysidine(34) synthetase TilS [Chloroflexi bacterium RBG_19FT_COMBO_55_16]|nr:MAG: tRNA lysidine(34) synthetase TilS [Chloroflexi bacterium RBG_19FT_COMBO_55_16]